MVRVGQIAGAVEEESGKVEWNRKEWLPSVSTTNASVDCGTEILYGYLQRYRS